ncbi:MAG: hypothetical protein JO336_19385, partial [Acidobacteriia bacterium]|nr:hypothetical protein [Terriglobia bacterium]
MLRIKWLLLLGSTVLLTAADSSWKNKEISQWTVEDAQQVLKSSPWVKPSVATILPQRSEAQQRDSGRMGGGTGAGLEAFDPANLVGFGHPSRGFAANLQQRRTLVVCWESALAVRGAEAKIRTKDAPSWEGEYYAIAVFGVPGLEDQKTLPTELKKTAHLKLNGKKDWSPARVEITYTSETQATVLYLF